MKNKIIIGKLTSRKWVICDMILGSVLFVGLYYLLINMFNQFPFFQTTPYAMEGIRISLIIMIIMSYIVVPSYGIKQYIEIDESYLSYYAAFTLKEKYLQSWRLITNQPQVPDLQLKIDHIDHMTLLYSDVYMGWAQKGHSIIFNITLKDGTLIRLQPDNLYFDKENCLIGIEYMEKLGIIVKDPYHLKDALKDTNMRFAEYVEKARKDHES